MAAGPGKPEAVKAVLGRGWGWDAATAGLTTGCGRFDERVREGDTVAISVSPG